jgi:hypothetical protein
MKVQLALYKGKGLIGNALIRWWTGSQYSHCELVVDGICYSSSLMDKGVRKKVIDLKPENWDLVDLPSYLAPGVLEYFELTKGQKYGWLDLIRSQIFNTASDEEGTSFCSEWCAKAIGIPSPTIYSPKTLHLLLLYLFSSNLKEF